MGLIKGTMKETKSQAHSVFVIGRQILDMVLVADEMVENYRSKEKSEIVLEIDFEKACDHSNGISFICAPD